MMDVIPEQRLARELASNEHLLWAGRPRQGIFFRPSDAMMVPFSLLWCGFAIFWESSVVTTGAPWFFKLWGVPFVVAGLYFVAGRFYTDARMRERTVYGVTSDRVVIISGLFRESVQSLPLRGISDLTLSERRDGSGTITLGPGSPMSAFAVPTWPASRQETSPTFDGIPHARVVYDLIRGAQRGPA